MITLACDTSGRICSVALLDGDVLLAEDVAESDGGHAGVFMPMVESMLQRMGMSYDSIGLFACVTGPGSFTGIRIGVATVQAMAYATGRPAMGVTTLDGLSFPWLDEPGQILCPVIDARNRRVYTQVLQTRTSGDPAVILEAGGMTVDDLALRLQPMAGTQPIRFFGDGSDMSAAVLRLRVRSDAAVFSDSRPVRSELIGRLALRRFTSSPGEYPAHALQPVYLGRSQAERTTGIDIADWRFSTEP